MDEVKYPYLPAVLSVGIIILLLLLVGACGIIAYLILSGGGALSGGSANAGPGGSAGGGAGIGQNATPQENETPAMNISQEDLELWNSITKENAEAACLKRAKEEANESAGMVFSCECDEGLRTGRKTYSCEIITADPLTKYFVNIDCYLDGRACTVESNYGTETVTFGELRDWYGK